jgi:transcription factor C subunit 3
MAAQTSANIRHDEPPINAAQSLSLGTRVNVSHLRRENELLRLVESLGGIANIQSKEFLEGHMRLLKSLAQSGEPTSAPVGTKIDKRTAVASLNSLERKGRLKQLKTSIMSHIGVNRPACIVYLPGIEQNKLDSFLADLAHASQPVVPHIGSVVKIDEPVEYGAADSTSAVRVTLPLQLLQVERPAENGQERWSRNISRANQLFSYDDATIRDVFLAEHTTVGQLYGFIVGKALRCRELHLATLKMFETRKPSPHVVSVEKRIVDVSLFCHDITIGLYCSLVSSLSYDEALSNLLATEEGRNTLVRDLPSTIHSSLQIGRSRSRSRFLDLLDILRSLGVVTPLQPSDSHTPFITCLPNGEHPTAFKQLTQDEHSTGPAVAPAYWYFPESAPVHVWAASETHPPFWKYATITTYADGLTYWKDLHEACTNPSSDISTQPLHQTAPSADISIARSLRRTVSWKTDYFFTWHQTQYLKQFVNFHAVDEQAQHDQVQKLCHVTSAPRDAVESYLSSVRDSLSKAQRRSKSQQKVEGRKRSQESKLLLAKKAEEARKHREKEWQTLLQKNHPDTLTDGAAVRIERIRNRFLQAGSIKDLKWEKEIQAALREANLASTRMPKLAKRTTLQPHIGPVGAQSTSGPLPETSIQTLINLQGPSILIKEKPKRKRKRDEPNAGMIVKFR